MAKKNIVVRLQNWMDSVAGQTFLNYAYSWGASIVILGTLFKLTHIAGADFMLFVGMGTEVIVFFLSAFDRPFDKEEEGKEMPEDYDILAEDDDEEETPAVSQQGNQAYMPQQGPVIIPVGGGYQPDGAQQPVAAEGAQPVVGNQPVGGADNVQPIANAISSLSSLTAAEEMIAAQKAAANPELETATNDYVEQLKSLTEILNRVAEQTSQLTQGSVEMETLNRTLTSLNSLYDSQLRSAGLQMTTIDQINEQTRRMASQIQELNNVYARMLQALTVTAPQFYQQPAYQQPGYQQPGYQQPVYQQPVQPMAPQQPVQK